jgi:hypothetical protein
MIYIVFNNLAHMGARSRFCRTIGTVDADVVVDACDNFEVSTCSSSLFFMSQQLLNGYIDNKKQQATYGKIMLYYIILLANGGASFNFNPIYQSEIG